MIPVLLGLLYFALLFVLRHSFVGAIVMLATYLVGHPFTFAEGFGTSMLFSLAAFVFSGGKGTRAAAVVLLLGATLGLTACATSSYREDPDGTVIAHVGALGEGAMGSICMDEFGKPLPARDAAEPGFTPDTQAVLDLVMEELAKAKTAEQRPGMTLAQMPALSNEVLAKLDPKQLAAALEELRFGQYPQGQCIAARGSSISKELEGLLRYYLYSKAVGAVGDALGGMVDAGNTAAGAEASATVIEAESAANVDAIEAAAAAGE